MMQFELDEQIVREFAAWGNCGRCAEIRNRLREQLPRTWSIGDVVTDAEGEIWIRVQNSYQPWRRVGKVTTAGAVDKDLRSPTYLFNVVKAASAYSSGRWVQ